MLTIPQVKLLKSKRKIVMLTAYDYLTASYLERAGIDIILVGDSLGMVIQGMKDTLAVTVDDIIYHTRTVRRGAADTMIIADMPFMSYQVSVEEALMNGGRMMKESGASAIKMEGGMEICPHIKALTQIGIPVMGHIGLQPQSVNKYGGYPVQGRTDEDKTRLMDEALALEEAGVFGITVEKTAAKTAAEITKAVKVPIIGIGSGPDCDGQVLVTHDMTGAFLDFKPAFVKQYENIAERTITAVKKYADDVKEMKFPGKNNYYK
jgi:3-methyl-2-oxobutanoate hydroxymethyltransferase